MSIKPPQPLPHTHTSFFSSVTGAQWNAADNGEGIDVHIAGVHKTDTTASSGWSTPGSSPQALSSGMVDWMATANAYIDVTGLQLEKGTIGGLK